MFNAENNGKAAGEKAAERVRLAGGGAHEAARVERKVSKQVTDAQNDWISKNVGLN